jgi:Sec-independent protein translocase protein TatA
MVDVGVWGLVFAAAVVLFVIFKGPQQLGKWAHSIGGAKRAFEAGVRGQPLDGTMGPADLAPATK